MLGRANRMLAKRVTAIATSFEHTKFLEGRRSPSARLTGNPVRDQVIDGPRRAIWHAAREGPFSLLVFGGSQGARFFSDAMPPALALLPEAIRASLFVVQQCREEDLARVEAAYRAGGMRAAISPHSSPICPRDGQGASRHRPRRRLDGGRADRHGPPGDPGAAAACARQRSAAERHQACRIRGGLVHRAEGADAQTRLARAHRPAARRTAGACGRPPHAAKAGPAGRGRAARRSGRGADRPTAKEARKVL